MVTDNKTLFYSMWPDHAPQWQITAFTYTTQTQHDAPANEHNLSHYSYRVDLTLDSKGQNWITIFFTALSATVALLGAAMFAVVTSNLDTNWRVARGALEGARG